MKKKTIISVVGARPNFMKVAPIAKAFKKHRSIRHMIVHTGQHYDAKMSQVFFKELGIPKPDINLEVKEPLHGAQTGEIMKRFEQVCLTKKPSCVIVVGDVNSTAACAMVAVKLGIKVAHVEAGLRSFDRTMPEEINRVVTDSISDLLFVTEKSGVENLVKEGVFRKKIHLVGNTMIDTLFAQKRKIEKSTILSAYGLSPKAYGLLTLHRPSNVDDAKALASVIAAIKKGVGDLPVIFPVHPRTKKQLKALKVDVRGITMVDPLGYHDFIALVSKAKIVVTDSGGIQEETSVLGVPCVTVRNNTERPITVTRGTNMLVGAKSTAITRGIRKTLKTKTQKRIIPLWDGKAAERIVEILRGRVV